jgi:hypothetical protein
MRAAQPVAAATNDGEAAAVAARKPAVAPAPVGVAVPSPAGPASPAKAPTLPPPQVTVTPEKLLKAYWWNERAASTSYTGKAVSVTGVMKDYRLNSEGDLLIELDANDQLNAGQYRVQCRMAPEERDRAAKLHVGQTVTMKGICEGKGPSVDPGGRMANVVVGCCCLVRVQEVKPAPEAPVTRVEGTGTHTYPGVRLGVRSVRMGSSTSLSSGGRTP